MKDTTIVMWLAIMLVIEVSAIASLVWLAVSGRALKLNKLMSVGVLLLTFGLAVQVVRSLHYFEFGTYPIDHVFPWWILKDLGGSMIIFYLAFFWRKETASPLETPLQTTEADLCVNKSTRPKPSSTASRSSPRR
jgi:hypothetical protein